MAFCISFQIDICIILPINCLLSAAEENVAVLPSVNTFQTKSFEACIVLGWGFWATTRPRTTNTVFDQVCTLVKCSKSERIFYKKILQFDRNLTRKTLSSRLGNRANTLTISIYLPQHKKDEMTYREEIIVFKLKLHTFCGTHSAQYLPTGNCLQ